MGLWFWRKKLKIENEKKVNLIVQTTFRFNFEEGIKQFKKLMKAINSNEYPIIIVEVFNGGGSALFQNILQKIINFGVNNIKQKYSNWITDLNLKSLSNNTIVSLNCQIITLKDYIQKEKIDKYSKK